MVGGIDEAVEQAKKLGGHGGAEKKAAAEAEAQPAEAEPAPQTAS